MKRIILIFICLFLLLVSIPSFATNNPSVIDNADVLTDSEEAELMDAITAAKERIMTASGGKDFDIVVLTVRSLGGKSEVDFADDYYDYNYYADHGILLLYAVNDNIIYLSSKGDGEYTTYYKDQMSDFSKKTGDYIRSGLICQGCYNYIGIVEREMLYYYENFGTEDFVDGNDYKAKKSFTDGLIGHTIFGFLVAFLVALGVTGSMKSKLNSVRWNNYAANYVKEGSLNITNSAEIFLYASVTKTPRPTSSSSSGGRSYSGGGHHSSSGSHHGGGRI